MNHVGYFSSNGDAILGAAYRQDDDEKITFPSESMHLSKNALTPFFGFKAGIPFSETTFKPESTTAGSTSITPRDDVKEKCREAGREPGVTDLYAAIMEGAVERVRPKMMTVVAIMAGLWPIMWGTGTGSEVMSRIAAPMVGGMVSSTVLTLAVIPAIYALVKQWRIKNGMED